LDFSLSLEPFADCSSYHDDDDDAAAAAAAGTKTSMHQYCKLFKKNENQNYKLHSFP
jgi:hypothetical protein